MWCELHVQIYWFTQKQVQIAGEPQTLHTDRRDIAMFGHPEHGELGEIRGLLKLCKMPTSSRARGVNATQMSTGGPTSQTKLAATCTNTSLRLPHICEHIFTGIQ